MNASAREKYTIRPGDPRTPGVRSLIALALTLVVWFSYHIEGIRKKGFIGYLRSFLPSGLESMNPIGKALIFSIELLSP